MKQTYAFSSFFYLSVFINICVCVRENRNLSCASEPDKMPHFNKVKDDLSAYKAVSQQLSKKISHFHK